MQLRWSLPAAEAEAASRRPAQKRRPFQPHYSCPAWPAGTQLRQDKGRAPCVLLRPSYGVRVEETYREPRRKPLEATKGQPA